MNCAKFQRLHMLHLDGSLSQDKEEGLQRHLAQCLSCQRETLRIQKLCAGFKKREFSPSEDVLRQIRYKAQERLSIKPDKSPASSYRIPLFLPRLGYGFIAIAVIFLFVSLLLSIKNNNQPRQSAIRDKKELSVSLAQKETQDTAKNIGKYLEDIYVAEVKKDIQQAFSVIDRIRSIAEMSPALEYLPLMPISKGITIEDTLEDLEGRIAAMHIV